MFERRIAISENPEYQRIVENSFKRFSSYNMEDLETYLQHFSRFRCLLMRFFYDPEEPLLRAAMLAREEKLLGNGSQVGSIPLNH